MKTRNLDSLVSRCAALTLILGCGANEVNGPSIPGTTGGSASVAGTPGVSGNGPTPGGASGVGGAGPVAGTGNPTAGTTSNPGGGASGAAAGGATAGGAPSACVDPNAVTPGVAPIRRLTKFEYNNTVATLLNDTTNPGYAFPSELLGNGFGNDAAAQPVSSLLASEYQKAAEGISQRATATPEALMALAPCAASVTAETEAACARTIVEAFAPRAYRRPLAAGEADELVALFDEVRPNSASFAEAIAALIEAVLAGPEFLYRVEFGVADAARPELKRPTGYEMATRLSYLFWGTQPDAALLTAAASGELLTNAGVLAQARRLLDDTSNRSHAIVRFFFDNLLPISNLTDLSRDTTMYPGFSPAIGALMQQETRTFLEYEVFQQGSGTWPGILTAPYTFVNQTLAAYYGIPGVQGDAFVRVDIDQSQRLGLLTQGALMVGTTPTNHTNPVLRGAFVLRHLMCQEISLPTDPEILAQVAPPDPYSGATARDRYTQHSANVACAGCHSQMDPMGLSLENYDAVGQYRTTENAVVIDATGSVPGMVDGAVNGPIELVRKLAANQQVMDCLPSQWLNYAYGRTLDAGDACTRERVQTAFRQASYNVKELLLAATQTDAFLYLPAGQQ